MSAAAAPPPLDPPPTEAELAWWKPQQRRLRLWAYLAPFIFFGLAGVTLSGGLHGWHRLFTRPDLALGLFAFEGTLFTTVIRLVMRKPRERTVLVKMTTAIRDRRIREALLTPPPD